MKCFSGCVLLWCAALAAQLSAQVLAPARPKGDKNMKPEDTEYFCPVPLAVTAPPAGIPSDAIVLFDGGNADAWQARNGGLFKWTVADGALTVAPGAGDIATKQAFGDIQLHLEFREPTEVTGDGQARGNSGVFFMGLYELQVLDGYDNPTYVDGQVGALYKQYAPLVNPSGKPGEWQTYDCVWVAPRFAEDGSVLSPARLTVFLNGVLTQYNIPAKGPTTNVGQPKYFKHPDKLPLALQEHHNKVSFRNIWVRELKLPDYSVSGTVPAPPNQPGSVLITVTTAGSILLNNKDVTDAELKQGLAKIHQSVPNILVIVMAGSGQGDQAAAVLAECRAAGLTNTSQRPPE